MNLDEMRVTSTSFQLAVKLRGHWLIALLILPRRTRTGDRRSILYWSDHFKAGTTQ